MSCHEVRLQGFVVDILREDEVYEIQSRRFYVLRHKLSKLLETHKVTVVYPVVRQKWIIWVDEESGQVVRRRKSPKMGRACHILAELYGIRDLLAHENLSFAVVSLDAEEYRRAPRRTSGEKTGSAEAHVCKGRSHKGQDRLECIPLVWHDMTCFGGTRERGLERVLPEFPELAGEFTSLEFGRAARLPRHEDVHKAMKVLSAADVIRCVGKQGRRCVYRKA